MKRTISIRPYIIIILLVAVVFSISSYFLIRSIEEYFYETMEMQYINYASIHSHGLAKTSEAYRIINDMLERRILSSIRTIGFYSDYLTNESIADLADTLAVDEIYLYNLAGEIEISTKEAYLGWKAYPGHPVYDFWTSGSTTYVEEIRRDSESDQYYKYGYLRLDDGRFLQIGVHADLVENFLAPFEIEQLLHEIGDFDLVDHVYYVSPDYSISACCDLGTLGLPLENPEVIEALASRSTESLRRIIEGQNREAYEIFIPIFVDEEYRGTLVVAKSTDEAKAMVHMYIFVASVVSVVVFGGFLSIMISNYRHNKRLATIAYTEAITGLPNKAYLREVLEEALEQPFKENKAILMIHFYNLNIINSTYGFDMGDKVIKQLAVKLEKFVSEKRQLFVFSSNRFILYVEDYDNVDELHALAENIIEELEPSLEIVGRPIEVKIGLVELESSLQPSDALSRASLALHHLELKKGNAGYAFFDAEIQEKVRREEIIAQEMAEFLTNQELGIFYLEYQPKIALASKQIVGFEALSRMVSPTLGRVSPLEFISIAERQEMIIPLGYWVLETALRFLRKLGDKGFDQVYVAVNISPIQLLQADFPKRVEEIITKTGVNPQRVQLEITESVLIEDFADIQKKLCPLREMGLTVALDDFGTGYSALSRMGELPVDFIKIDKSFIDKILLENDQRQIIQEIISMCHKLGLIVVAEGVECEEQLKYLLASGCDVVQGYLYSKPLPEHRALEKLQENLLDD